MKLKTGITQIILALVIILTCCLPFFGCGDTHDDNPPDDTHSKDPYVIAVEVVANPTRTSYLAGETFSPKGLTFKATWMIDGKETVTTLTYGSCDGWTHKNEPLTPDVTEIEFTIGGYTFKIPIVVNAVEQATLVVDRSMFEENYLLGTELDLTTLVVKVSTDETLQETDEYVLYDNGNKIEKDDSLLAHYLVTEKGKHTYTVEFGDIEETFDIMFWDENDLTVDDFNVTGKVFKESYNVGEAIDLTIIKVQVTLKSADGTFVIDKYVTDYTLKDNGVNVPQDQMTSYSLTAGNHTFTIEYRGNTDTFDLIAEEYDTLEWECVFGNEDITLLQHDAIDMFEFYHYFRVYMTMSMNPSKKVVVYPNEYTITYKKNGVEQSAGEAPQKQAKQNLLKQTGEYEVTFHYGGLDSEPANFTVKAMNTRAKDTVLSSANGAVTNVQNGENIRPGGRSYFGVTSNNNKIEDLPDDDRSWIDMRGKQNDKYSRTSSANYFGDQLSYISNFGSVINKSELRIHIYSDSARKARVSVEMASHDVVMQTIKNDVYTTVGATETADISVKEHFLPTLFKSSGTQKPTELEDLSDGFTEKEVPDATIYGYESRITDPDPEAPTRGPDEKGRYYDSAINTAFSVIDLGEFDLQEGYNTVVIRVNPEKLVNVAIGSINVLYLD